VLAAIVLVASGFSYFVVRDVSSIGGSHAITGGPSMGPQNILLTGLESRRDWNGNIYSYPGGREAGSRLLYPAGSRSNPVGRCPP
jgi:hypothetical protein